MYPLEYEYLDSEGIAMVQGIHGKGHQPGISEEQMGHFSRENGYSLMAVSREFLRVLLKSLMDTGLDLLWSNRWKGGRCDAI